MTVPVEDPRRKFWREVIPTRPNVMLAGADVFQSHLVLFEREDGLPYLRIVDLPPRRARATRWPLRTASNSPSPPTTPRSVPTPNSSPVICVSSTNRSSPRARSSTTTSQPRERILRKQQPVLGGYDPAQYVSERLHATAHDGTRVPISIVHRRDTPRDSSRSAAPLRLRQLRHLHAGRLQFQSPQPPRPRRHLRHRPHPRRR